MTSIPELSIPLLDQAHDRLNLIEAQMSARFIEGYERATQINSLPHVSRSLAQQFIESFGSMSCFITDVAGMNESLIQVEILVRKLMPHKPENRLTENSLTLHAHLHASLKDTSHKIEENTPNDEQISLIESYQSTMEKMLIELNNQSTKPPSLNLATIEKSIYEVRHTQTQLDVYKSAIQPELKLWSKILNTVQSMGLQNKNFCKSAIAAHKTLQDIDTQLSIQHAMLNRAMMQTPPREPEEKLFNQIKIRHVTERKIADKMPLAKRQAESTLEQAHHIYTQYIQPALLILSTAKEQFLEHAQQELSTAMYLDNNTVGGIDDLQVSTYFTQATLLVDIGELLQQPMGYVDLMARLSKIAGPEIMLTSAQ